MTRWERKKKKTKGEKSSKKKRDGKELESETAAFGDHQMRQRQADKKGIGRARTEKRFWFSKKEGKKEEEIILTEIM